VVTQILDGPVVVRILSCSNIEATASNVYLNEHLVAAYLEKVYTYKSKALTWPCPIA